MPERLSLYDEVRSRGYEAALIATYNLDFQFYERMVLRRLQSSGCRHNIILADAKQCAKALVSDDFYPALCGSAYTLLPIRSAAAFHPKFIMLLGRRKARLIVGSHNLTISGFGLNREIATAIDIKPDRESDPTSAKVWEFVSAWTKGFSSEMREVIKSTERISPWLASNVQDSAEPQVLCSLPSGPSLWEQLKQQLAHKIKRILVISSSFDSKLNFVRTLENELNPKECMVAVHRQFTNIPTNAVSLVARTRFLDVTQLGGDWDSPLHAKVYGFELTNGKTIVVSGSANASDLAWLAPPLKRNAEMVVVHKDGDRICNQLGLTRLSELPEVDEDGWKAIRRRADQPKKDSVTLEAPFLATRAADGFIVDEGFTRSIRAEDIRVFVGRDEGATAVEQIEPSGDHVRCVCHDATARDSATSLQVVNSKGTRRIAIVHHTDDLLDKAVGGFRQEFRRAFTGLEADPEQLTQLLKVVEKAIFDEPVSVDVRNVAGKMNRGQKHSASPTLREPTSLMISVQDTVHARRRQRRVFASSDLALIIDALIYRLGRGLHEETDSAVAVEPSDVDLKDQTVEPPPTPTIDGHLIAKVCRGKINRLFGRMTAQLELAVKRSKDATTPVIQLAAVLGVVRHLRVGQSSFAWLPRGERLVDPDHQCEFFKKAARLLYAPKCMIAGRALAEHDHGEFDELTAVRGLMAWLALDCGVDCRIEIKPLLDDPSLTRENLIRLGYFVPVISQCVCDNLAAAVLTNVASQQKVENGDSAAYHLHWALELLSASKNQNSSPLPIELGDVAMPLKIKDIPPSIVVEVQPTKLGLLDLNTGEPRYFATGYLKRIQGLRVQ